ncbi:hypothetical protein [Demequina litorisediminis]|uniref:hypothetical protein n=1 Tax=Demequina litorisediminis TaxID=1849022 RepID=UPI0032AE9860
MSDNPRTIMYGAQYHAEVASRVSDAPATLSRVVGKHCESGDIIVRDVQLPEDTRRGDLLAVAATGAYGRSMASTYNAALRPAVVAVRDGASKVLVRRDTLEDLLSLGRRGGLGPASARREAARHSLRSAGPLAAGEAVALERRAHRVLERGGLVADEVREVGRLGHQVALGDGGIDARPEACGALVEARLDHAAHEFVNRDRVVADVGVGDAREDLGEVGHGERGGAEARRPCPRRR